MHKERMKSCPSYQSCRAPICPLESIYPSKSRFRFPEEAECVAHKSKRYRLGEGLKFHGLFIKEYQAHVRTGGFAKLEDLSKDTTTETQIQGG